MSEEQSIPIEACECARWTTHHVTGKPALQCTRWTGPGGALWMSAKSPGCRRCRYNVAGIAVTEGDELVDMIAKGLAANMPLDPEGAKLHLYEVLAKGATGVDLAEPGAQEFVQKILAAAVARGLSVDDAVMLSEEVGLADAVRRSTP